MTNPILAAITALRLTIATAPADHAVVFKTASAVAGASAATHMQQRGWLGGYA